MTLIYCAACQTEGRSLNTQGPVFTCLRCGYAGAIEVSGGLPHWRESKRNDLKRCVKCKHTSRRFHVIGSMDVCAECGAMHPQQ